MQREGSPWHGVGVVTRKELSDHLSSMRMLIIELLVVVTGVVVVLVSLQQIRDVTAEDPFLLLRVFTRSGEQLSFVFVLTLLVPLIAIGLGFDLVNSEYNQRTLSRVLSQPI
jgi:ABC-2 type transport system permease protein